MRKIIILFAVLYPALQLFAQPVIRSFEPAAGPVGTVVLIKGAGFDTTATGNTVYFGAAKAAVFTATDTTLKVVVPAGATYQAITATANNRTGYSLLPFVVTFDGDDVSFTSNSFLPQLNLTTGKYPHAVTAADFNGDGKLDLLVSKGSSGTVSLFKNTTSDGALSFAPKLEVAAAGNSHEDAAIGDLDGDGKLDFVVVNTWGTSSISIFRNTSTNRNLSFAAKLDYEADNAPYSVAIGDLNSDGKPDVVVANTGSNKLSIYRNKSMAGTILFEQRMDIEAGTNPYSIAINDLDGDGKADLAVTTQGTGSALSVLKNITASDTIAFDAPVDFASLSGSFIVSIGDLDGDGKPDVAAASAGAGAVVLRNLSTPGMLSFGSQQFFTAGNYPVCIAMSDLDGDGKPDLVLANRGSNDVSALKNSSMPGAISFEAPIYYAVGEHPLYVAAGDLDGDGRPDLAAANSSSEVVSILKNMIGTNLAPRITSFTPASGRGGTLVKITGQNFTGTTGVTFGGIAAASFTVDSATGITAVVASGASGDVGVTTAYGTATRAGFVFTGPIITSFTPTMGVSGTVVTIMGSNFVNVTEVRFGGTPAASFKAHSATQITATVGAGKSGDVSVVTANGTATAPGFSFGAPTITSFAPASGPVGSAVVITGTSFDTNVSNNTVFFGAVKATVTSATATQLQVTVPAGATYEPITVTTNRLTAYAAEPFIVTGNDTAALSRHSFSQAIHFGTGTYPVAVAVSDLNGDGKTDLITANSVGNNISVLKNTSSGRTISFGPRINYSTGPDPKRLAIGDLDGDGKPDVIVTNSNAGNSSAISVFRNTSAGETISFASKMDYPTGNGTIGIAIADLEGDGKPDVVVTSGNSGFISIFKNTTVSAGVITFAPKQDYTSFDHPNEVRLVDLEKDGRPDIITSNFSNETISIFRNASAGGTISFQKEPDYATGKFPTHLAAGDLNRDGKMDLTVSCYATGTISIFKNESDAGVIALEPKKNLALDATNIAIADLNGDGKLDLCVGQGLTGAVSVLENKHTGDGAFSFGDTLKFAIGNYDTFVAAGDLNGDGKPEVITANTILNTVAVLENKTAEPAIDSISVTSGGTGDTVVLSGARLAGATAVEFGGTPAQAFTILSSTKIKAVVGGGTSGNITITTPSGTAAVGGFKFIPHISAAGPAAFCNGDSVRLTSSAIANNQWYKNGVAINGARAQNLVVNASGMYTVRTTSNGITTVSDSGVAVTVKMIPAPVISKDTANNLVSSAATGNQWFVDGTLISGATSSIYRPLQSGSYTVQHTLEGCVSDFSAAFNFVLTGITDIDGDATLKLYPNPVKGKLYLDWSDNNIWSVNVTVTDIYGKQILVSKNLRAGATVDVSHLPAGIYLVRIYSERSKTNHTVKVIKAE